MNAWASPADSTDLNVKCGMLSVECHSSFREITSAKPDENPWNHPWQDTTPKNSVLFVKSVGDSIFQRVDNN